LDLSNTGWITVVGIMMPIMPGSKSMTHVLPTDSKAIMYGSKSAPVAQPPQPSAKQKADADLAGRVKAAPVLSGSDVRDAPRLELVPVHRSAGSRLHARDRTALEIARRGVFMGFDQIAKQRYAPDSLRVEFIARLCEAGHAAQILLSQDQAHRSYRPSYGYPDAPGLAYILETFVPMLREAGFSSQEIDGFLIENPKRAFSFSGISDTEVTDSTDSTDRHSK